MMTRGYALVALPSAILQPGLAGEDILAIAASPLSDLVHFEIAGKRSRILRLAANQIGQSTRLPEEVVEGYDPVTSSDGRWLAYLTDADGKTEIHLWKDGSALPVTYSERVGDILEMSLSAGGALIFASGGAANPHLSKFDPSSGGFRKMNEIPGAIRFPATSPNGKNLAFSRRESGAWHLVVRDLSTAVERQLTTAACNATAPSWEDAHTLLYVSDCGRGLGMSAPVRVDLNY
ncbi:MAG: TolB family protein, partial [Candidatus Sulfotelmatobacter sp.]